jgi:hypothetical protein
MADIPAALAPSRSGFTPGRIGGTMVACPIRPTMFARIGIMQALNRHHVREFDLNRKPHHWGKRKLKRDV